MIPILFEKGESTFTTNGLGRLSECISCCVTEEKNGIYEMEFVYPMDGRYFNYMVDRGGVVCAWHDDKHDIQAFDIYAHSDPINGLVTFNAHHISYRLNRIITAPFTAQSPASALASLKLNAVNDCPFTFWTDKTGSSEMLQIVPSDIRSLLFGKEGSILDVYGKGEYEFDMFNVKLYVNRGTDTNITVRYGKNLTDIKKEYDESAVFNAIAPYWTGESGVIIPEEVIVVPTNITLKEYPLSDENGNTLVSVRNTGTSQRPVYTTTELTVTPNFATVLPVAIDFSDDFEEEPTEEDLRNAALDYINQNETWLPDENITVDFVALWQSPEYEDIAILQRCSLCDTISVYYPELGVIAEKQKIIKVVYDVLLERYQSIELGKRASSLSENIAADVLSSSILSEVPTTSMMEAAIAHATQMITGGLGGYVVLKSNANGQTEEILIMDTPSVNTAVHVIRMNKNGIGFSSNGYNGPFTSAWTIDGSFNANFITAGAINASLITVGSLIADIIKTGRVESANGKVYFDLDNNELCCSKIVQNVNETRESKVVAEIEPHRTNVSTDAGAFKIYKEYRDGTTDTKPFRIKFSTDGYAQLVSSENNMVLTSHDANDHSNCFIQLGSNGRILIDAMPYGHTGAQLRVNYDTTSSSGGRVEVIGRLDANDDVYVTGAIYATGGKSRLVSTTDYSDRLLYCYETPTPMFGDIGEAFLDEEGVCYIDIDDIFGETVNTSIEYQVFLQKESSGDIWVSEKNRHYFVVNGTPGMKFAWELKAKQRCFEYYRLDVPEQINYGIDDRELDQILEEDQRTLLMEMEEALYEAAI